MFSELDFHAFVQKLEYKRKKNISKFTGNLKYSKWRTILEKYMNRRWSTRYNIYKISKIQRSNLFILAWFRNTAKRRYFSTISLATIAKIWIIIIVHKYIWRHTNFSTSGVKGTRNRNNKKCNLVIIRFECLLFTFFETYFRKITRFLMSVGCDPVGGKLIQGCYLLFASMRLIPLALFAHSAVTPLFLVLQLPLSLSSS